MNKWNGAYVCHVCKKCESAFVAEDYTRAKDIPPHWRYCPDCAKELGIDYEKQKPGDYRTAGENARYKARAENLKKVNEKRRLEKQKS